jgi:hypothetical protein
MWLQQPDSNLIKENFAMNKRKDETDEQFIHRVHDQGKVFGKDYLTEQDHKNIDDELRLMGILPPGHKIGVYGEEGSFKGQRLVHEDDDCKYDAQGLSEQEKEGLTCLIISADHTWEYQEPGIPSKVCSFPMNEDANRMHSTSLEVGNLIVHIMEKK